MVAQGLRNKEIAKGLNVQEGTVKQHIYVAMAKMDCRTRNRAGAQVRNAYAGKH
jgi:DNA-binding NarL/FixJ family response regulator